MLTQLLHPSPGRLAFATRLALICAFTTLVTALYGTPSAALTVYLAFFINKPDRAESLLLCVAMTVLITLVLGATVLVVQGVIDMSAWRVGAMTAISFGLLFLVSASKLRPIGSSMALIVAYALAVLGSVTSGELATRFLLYAWLFGGIL